MSVAEKLPVSETVGPVTTASSSITIDNILRLALNGVARRGSSPAKPQELDFNKAADLLDRATTAIAGLTSRRDELEQAFAEKLRAALDEAAEWERRAKVIKAQLQDCENRLSEQQIRIETLTYRAENAEARVAIAEEAVADSRKQVQMYHDKIMSTFGALV